MNEETELNRESRIKSGVEYDRESAEESVGKHDKRIREILRFLPVSPNWKKEFLQSIFTGNFP